MEPAPESQRAGELAPVPARLRPASEQCREGDQAGVLRQRLPFHSPGTAFAAVDDRHRQQRETTETAEHDDGNKIAVGDDMGERPKRERPQHGMPRDRDDAGARGGELPAAEADRQGVGQIAPPASERKAGSMSAIGA